MTRPTLSRRSFLQACGAAGTALALPVTLGGCGTDPGVTIDGGDPLPVPPIDDGELIAGVRVFRLDLQAGTVDFGAGAPTATYGVNGAYLGPTLRFRRGERVRLEVTNSLAEPSTLHWHGMHVPAASDGGPYVMVAPGATWVTEYDVTQRPMTAWYHPHPMHQTGRQVYMGLAGVIYVEEPTPPADLPSTYGVDDLPLVIQDRRFFADGTHPYSGGATVAMHDMMAGLKGQTMLVNGAVQPRGVIARGLVRLRVLNGSNARAYHLGFADGRGFRLIASDGGLLEAPVTTSRVLVAPGERVELLVDFAGDATGATVALQSYSGEVFGALFTGQMGANLADGLDRATFDLATFEVGAPPPTTIVPPRSFAPIARLAEGDAARARQVTLAMGMGAVSINGTQMTDLTTVPAAISFDIPVGDVELWTITNTSGMAHPFHVHHRQFQVLDVDGAAPPAALAGWKDTVVIGPGQVVRLLLSFAGVADRAVPYMFHCHILEHEDHGMMGRFFLIPP
ncbi:MAG: multicopper oxidase domain-containing protein [Myxococcales bacterium]|nr:multicopper oxidase domain-containing protein [Myxococcales bacterium]